ncbi:hypothetical protein CDAR_560811 [Caerostris darwini]|uniref:Uncharacterized protein n=1 Tax=Caerostris darwini TaxID=1538125 RepID=A0AAV4U029_9ARAC|nr:hypothetical protein CDAR_560811 [Caerostris darwini]
MPSPSPPCITGHIQAISITIMYPWIYSCLFYRYDASVHVRMPSSPHQVSVFTCMPLLRPSCIRMHTHIISIAIMHPCAYSYHRHHQHVSMDILMSPLSPLCISVHTRQLHRHHTSVCALMISLSTLCICGRQQAYDILVVLIVISIFQRMHTGLR